MPLHTRNRSLDKQHFRERLKSSLLRARIYIIISILIIIHTKNLALNSNILRARGQTAGLKSIILEQL